MYPIAVELNHKPKQGLEPAFASLMRERQEF
jgi:hypothetical protein